MSDESRHVTLRTQGGIATSDRRSLPLAAAWIAALFVAILAVRFSIVDSPPYFDAAIGIWREAEFLARTNFDFMSLRYDCHHGLSEQGGPRSYMTSVVPPVLALLFQVFPNSHAPIVIYHLAVFLAAAIAAVLMFQLLRPRVGRWIAALSCAAFTTTPVYCVQIDMVGFETFLSLAGVAWLVAIDRRRFNLAALLSLLAFLIKPTGAILAASLLAYLGVRFVVELASERKAAMRTFFAAALCAGVLASGYLLMWWGGSVDLQLAGRLSLAMAWAWFPDVATVALVVAFAYAAIVAIAISRIARTTQEPRAVALGKAAASAIQNEPAIVVSACVVAMMALAIANVRFVPRYAAFAVPFLFYLLAIALAGVAPTRAIPKIVLACVVAINVVNWNGLLLPDLGRSLERFADVPGEFLAREGSLLERSHEYLPNHRENLRAARIAAKAANGRPVLTSSPFSTYLAYPQFGVVETPLVVYSTFPMGGAVSQMRETADFLHDKPPEVICLRDASTWFTTFAKMEIPAPMGDDVVLYADSSGRQLTVALVGFSSDSGRKWETWTSLGLCSLNQKSARLWSAYRIGGAAAVRAVATEMLSKPHTPPQKNDGGARANRERKASPADANILAILAAADAKACHWPKALENLAKADAQLNLFERVPQSTSANVDDLADALNALVRGDLDRSAECALSSVAKNAPPIATLINTYRVASDRLIAGDDKTAEQLFRTILKTYKSFAPAMVGLAKIRWRGGKVGEAESLLEEACADQPSAEQPHRLLALLLASEGRHEAAKTIVARYLDEFPSIGKIAQVGIELDEKPKEAGK